jgi:hypothetical protein
MTQSSRTFRIFVSSTFSDLKVERNALQEKVFPRLRDFATSHGCRFQANDLRWGVSEEAALELQHQVEKLSRKIRNLEQLAISLTNQALAAIEIRQHREVWHPCMSAGSTGTLNPSWERRDR